MHNINIYKFNGCQKFPESTQTEIKALFCCSFSKPHAIIALSVNFRELLLARLIRERDFVSQCKRTRRINVISSQLASSGQHATLSEPQLSVPQIALHGRPHTHTETHVQ